MTRSLFRTLQGISLAAVFLALASCRDTPPATLRYEVVSTRTHDPDAYTQGLEFSKGRLFESTGQYGASTLRELDPASGNVIRKRPLAKEVFGEGITIFNHELWMLTWKENTAYVFEPETFKRIRTYEYTGEGWGLTHNDSDLIMSDGSSTLKFLDPKNFSIRKTLEVTDGKTPVKSLNELEWINGQIFANIYLTTRIARISPEDGHVTGWLDLAGLVSQFPRPNHAEVLNGIALDPATGHLLVTGKYWPLMFEIKLIE